MDYQTIDGEFQATYEILHSVFICSIKGVNTFSEGMDFCKTIARKYNEATHNCYAVCINTGEQKFSDDGEPQGTAGQPMMQVLKKRNLTNVAAVVTRYFGGIKLGAGGLVSAYTQSVADGIAAAKTIIKTHSAAGKIILDYNEYPQVSNYLRGNNYIVVNTVYNDNVEVTFALPISGKEFAEEKISQITSGKKRIVWGQEDYLTF